MDDAQDFVSSFLRSYLLWWHPLTAVYGLDRASPRRHNDHNNRSRMQENETPFALVIIIASLANQTPGRISLIIWFLLNIPSLHKDFVLHMHGKE